jgi:hypothetical protein
MRQERKTYLRTRQQSSEVRGILTWFQCQNKVKVVMAVPLSEGSIGIAEVGLLSPTLLPSLLFDSFKEMERKPCSSPVLARRRGLFTLNSTCLGYKAIDLAIRNVFLSTDC